MIAIDDYRGLVFEGRGRFGLQLSPSPFLSRATVIEREDDLRNLTTSSPLVHDIPMIFREDFFDPVTRMRRGRLYQKPLSQAQPDDWHTMAHDLAQSVSRSVFVYAPYDGLAQKLQNNSGLLLALGAANAINLWRVITVEKIFSGEDLITLRARHCFGALPDLIESNIPETYRHEVLLALNQVADAAFRSNAISLIDLCRDAATVVLSRWLAVNGNSSENFRHLDLGQVQKEISDDQIALKAAIKLIQRFHSRGKTNEQERYSVRPPSEDDAELVLNSFGFILREIGWAR